MGLGPLLSRGGFCHPWGLHDMLLGGMARVAAFPTVLFLRVVEHQVHGCGKVAVVGGVCAGLEEGLELVEYEPPH